MQKAFSPSHVPNVAGYDGDEDPLNVPKNVKLDICAWMVFCMAITEQFCTVMLQDAIYKHHRVSETDPQAVLVS